MRCPTSHRTDVVVHMLTALGDSSANGIGRGFGNEDVREPSCSAPFSFSSPLVSLAHLMLLSPVRAPQTNTSIWKVLIFDKYCHDIIMPLLSVVGPRTCSRVTACVRMTCASTDCIHNDIISLFDDINGWTRARLRARGDTAALPRVCIPAMRCNQPWCTRSLQRKFGSINLFAEYGYTRARVHPFRVNSVSLELRCTCC